MTHPSETAPRPDSTRGDKNNAGECTRLITRDAAAAYLGMGVRTLDRLKACQAVPCIKRGRSVRFDRRELDAWIAAGCPDTPGAAGRIKKGVRR